MVSRFNYRVNSRGNDWRGGGGGIPHATGFVLAGSRRIPDPYLRIGQFRPQTAWAQRFNRPTDHPLTLRAKRIIIKGFHRLLVNSYLADLDLLHLSSTYQRPIERLRKREKESERHREERNKQTNKQTQKRDRERYLRTAKFKRMGFSSIPSFQKCLL